jgi:uncharacterized repeat protein (TIGR02543 family)
MSENLQMIQELDVSPKKIRAKTGSFQVTVSNSEERKNEYRLTAEDPDEMCTYNFGTDTVTAEAGATVTVTLTVRFKDILPAGAPKICNFTVMATRATGEVEMAQGQLERPALLPRWALAAGGVAAVAIIAIVIVLAGGGDNTSAPTVTLTIAVNGGGSTTLAVGGHEYSEGEVVNITATAASGWRFDSWTGAWANSSSANTTVTMDANKTITANFSEAPVATATLTMAVNGSGSITPAVGGHEYSEGEVVNITATAASGWQFDSWTGAGANSSSANTTVTMDANKTITANFSEAPAPIPNLNGVWKLEVFNINSTCGPEPGWSSNVTIVQEGDSLETNGVKGTSFIVTGSIAGETVTIGPGAFPDGTGTTTATYIMTIKSDTLMEGTEEWTWTDGTDTCSNGAATIRATRME